MITQPNDSIGIAATTGAAFALSYFGITDPETVRWVVYSSGIGAGAFLVITISGRFSWWDRILTTIRSVIIGLAIGWIVIAYSPDEYSDSVEFCGIVFCAAIYFGQPVTRALRIFAHSTGSAMKDPNSIRAVILAKLGVKLPIAKERRNGDRRKTPRTNND